MAKRGRPSAYDPVLHPAQAAILSQVGMTEEEIARALGVTWRSLKRWKEQYSEFRQAITEQKSPADAQVVAASFRRAVGYDVEEIEETFDAAGKLQRRKISRRHINADPTAQRLWLINRLPQEWRDKHDVNISDMSDEQLKAEVARLVAAGALDSAGVPAPATGLGNDRADADAQLDGD